LREGFREILRDPALLLIEIAWRWSFGIIVILLLAASIFLVLGSISIDSQRLQSLARLNLWQSAQIVADSLVVAVHQLLRIGVSATLFLAFCWICLSAFGRYATLKRPAFGHEPQICSCFAINAARAAVSVGAIALWIAIGLIAGVVGSVGRSDALPHPGIVVAILGPALVLLLAAWSLANWYLSLAPLFLAPHWQLSISMVWNFLRWHRDQIIEISIASGILRAVVFLAAFMLSFAVAAIVSNPRVLMADLIAISLLYCLITDFIYVARLAAYGKLASETMAQQAISGTPRAQTAPEDASQERSAPDTLSVPPESLLDQT